MRKPSVFISSSVEELSAARELARQLESAATATVWSEGAFVPGQTIIESLTEMATHSDFTLSSSYRQVSQTPGGLLALTRASSLAISRADLVYRGRLSSCPSALAYRQISLELSTFPYRRGIHGISMLELRLPQPLFEGQ
jgi:hypothetical protein